MGFAKARLLFHTREFDRSVDFYERVLGLARVAGWDRPDSKGALLSAAPATIVEVIGVAPDDPRGDETPRGVVLMLETDDADREYERLSRLGAAVEGPPLMRPWGHKAFVVRDPHGVAIEIHSPPSSG